MRKKTELRSVQVNFTNGDKLTTSMAAHLSDDDIRNYYAIGKTFNIGSVTDRMAQVQSVVILK